jgi:predicted transcriptional regulator
MSEPLELEIWRKIFNTISKNPGVDLQKIAELLNMKASQVESYLNSMELHGEITASKDEPVKRYYAEASSLSSRLDRRADDTRIKLYNLILQNPGLHLRKIAEILEMSSPLAEYHLTYLEKNNYVISAQDEKGYYKRFYIKYSDVGVEDKQKLAILRQEPLLKIVLLLIKHRSLQHKEIAEKLRISPSTLSYHLNKLIEYRLIEVFHHGDEKGYSLKNEKEIIWIVRRYKLDKIIEGFKDTWGNLDLF